MNTFKKASILDSKKSSEDIKVILVKTNTKKVHIPGQFYSIKVKDKDGFDVIREYSLSNAPNNNGILEFGIQKVDNGIVSGKLWDVKKGDSILVKGPTGKYFNFDSKNKGDLIFIAGGAGIVPFMSMLRCQFKKANIGHVLLIGSFKTSNHIPYLPELKKYLNTTSSFKMTLTLTRKANKLLTPETGRIDTNFLKRFNNELLQREAQIFICGRTQFVKDIKDMLLQIKVNEENIQSEYFG